MSRPPLAHERIGIDALHIGSPGWQGEYERLAQPAGVVALLPSVACDSTAAKSLCLALHERGFSTLCVECGVAADLESLTPRLIEALEWLRDHGPGAPVGVYGCGIGACAALSAAALRPSLVGALVAQGACPDFVLEELPRVRAPTLLVVGQDDAELLRAHRRALPLLGGARRLEIVPGAGACRADGAAAQAVAHLAAHWFAHRLPMRPLH
jgi:pimeloyl-ACP methyl ester carboxylesterase